MSKSQSVTLERFEAAISALTLRMDNLLEISLDTLRRVTHLEVQMVEVHETLGILTEAEAKDAIASINHEQRIARLEKKANIVPIPPAHLADFA